jgi:hypothetical protein
MLETMREECERRILEMKREEKRGMLWLTALLPWDYHKSHAEEADVRQENKRLIAVIDAMK